MPRVAIRTRSKGGHKEYRCSGCGKNVEPGEKFYTWSRRFGRSGQTYYQHVACGYPRATQLSSRKTAAIEDAINDAQKAISEWSFDYELTFAEFKEGGSIEIETDDIDSIIEDVASEAQSVGEEYESGADNMPESLQYGQQAEAMREVASELEDWADRVRDWDNSVDTSVEIPDPGEFPTEVGSEGDVDEEAWLEAAQTALNNGIDEIKEAASAAFEDMPEYQG